MFNPKIILSIDTSCDDTSVSVVKKKNQISLILSNIVSSQIEIHKKYGGVYPTFAKREHQRNLVFVLKRSLIEAGLLKLNQQNKKLKNDSNSKTLSRNQIKNKRLKKILEREEILYKPLKKFLTEYQKPKIDAVAITNGPGLEPCLWVGVNFAKAISYYWNLPIIPVNHIKGHILANWLETINSISKNPKNKIFPIICLVVSGGHSQLILMKNFRKYRILGETRDDAAGECLDKTARILGLEYPGGPIIAEQAAHLKNKKSDIKLPRPLFYSKDYDFSFSGLKTAVLYDFKKRSPEIRKSKKYVQAMCKEIQQAIIDVLIKKTLKAVKDYKVKAVVLAGGVAANKELSEQLKHQLSIIDNQLIFLVPSKDLCTDNAAMIGAAAGFYSEKMKSRENLEVMPHLRIDEQFA